MRAVGPHPGDARRVRVARGAARRCTLREGDSASAQGTLPAPLTLSRPRESVGELVRADGVVDVCGWPLWLTRVKGQVRTAIAAALGADGAREVYKRTRMRALGYTFLGKNTHQ